MDDLHAMKTCARCRRERPLSDFPLRRKDGAKRYGHCRECKAAYQRQWYERNRDRHIENVSAIRRELRRKHAEIVAREKSRPCADCGVTYPPYVMDFDHVRGKKIREIAVMRGSVSTQTLMAEIAKCEVVCANCHRIRTYRRRNGRR
jgi:hypothetical protein